MTPPVQHGPRSARAYHWLAALPGLAMLAGVVFANRAHPLVLGLPFLLFWILVCVLATSAVMALIDRLDESARRRSGLDRDVPDATAGGAASRP